MSKITSFVKETIARLKGDEAEVIGIKNQRKANVEVKYQLSALESEKLRLEEALATAKENALTALYPTSLITDGQRYCDNIKNAEEALTDATDALENVNYSIAMFSDILVKINA